MLPSLGSEKLASKHSQKTMACVKYSTLLNVQGSKPAIQPKTIKKKYKIYAALSLPFQYMLITGDTKLMLIQIWNK